MFIGLDRFEKMHAVKEGERYVFWCHGCGRNCPGCIAEQWNKHQKARLSLSADTIANMIIESGVSEIMLSGGEPLLYAAAWLTVTDILRQKNRRVGIFLYTGYNFDEIADGKAGEAAVRLLERLDALIDGPYIRELDRAEPWRGSCNQNLHLLSTYFTHDEFYAMERADTVNYDGDLFISSIPLESTANLFTSIVTKFESISRKEEF